MFFLFSDMARPDEIFGKCGDYYSIGIAIGGDYDHSGVPGATPDGGGVPPYHPVTNVLQCHAWNGWAHPAGRHDARPRSSIPDSQGRQYSPVVDHHGGLNSLSMDNPSWERWDMTVPAVRGCPRHSGGAVGTINIVTNDPEATRAPEIPLRPKNKKNTQNPWYNMIKKEWNYIALFLNDEMEIIDICVYREDTSKRNPSIFAV